MKKLLSVVLVLALALTGFAIAEAVSSDRTQLSTEAQIAAMTRNTMWKIPKWFGRSRARWPKT